MEKIAKYKEIARQVINEAAGLHPDENDAISNQLIFDEPNSNYLLVMNGWMGESRFYGIIIHIEVKDNGRVWVHQDNTDLIIVDQLLERGIPKEDIVLGFHAPIMRPDTDFAVA